MSFILLLLACGTAVEATPEPVPPEPVEEAAPAPAKKPKVTNAAWEGTWAKDQLLITTVKKGKKMRVKLLMDGEVLKAGELEGKGLKRTAAIEGCGATLKLSDVGGDLSVDLDGPECPIDFIGTFTNTVSP